MLGDPRPLGDHPGIYLQADLLDVVDPLEAEVEDLDPQIQGARLCRRQHLRLERAPSLLDPVLPLGLALSGDLLSDLLGDGELPVAGPDHLDEVVLGDHVAGLAVEDVVEPGLSTLLRAQPLEVLERVGDPPARISVDVDEPLVTRRHLIRVAIPFQEALVEVVGYLDEGFLELQSGFGDRLAFRLTELGDHDLLGLVDDVHAAGCAQQAQHHDDTYNDGQWLSHSFTSWEVSGSSGRMPSRL